MTWSEMTMNKKPEYHVCSICKKCPAFALHDDRDDWIQESPYCRIHWLELVNNKFDLL